jgi:hypothetical protein
MKTETSQDVAPKSTTSIIVFGGPAQASQGTRVNISTSTQMDQGAKLPKTVNDHVCRSSIANLFSSDYWQQ